MQKLWQRIIVVIAVVVIAQVACGQQYTRVKLNEPTTPALSATLAPAAPAPNQAAKSWEIDDKRIGAPGTAYIDNEYWQDGKKMAWMDGSLNLWLCDVEVSSGKLIPEDGKGIQIGKGAPFALAINSVDWGFSKKGAAVYAVRPDNNGLFQIWRTYVNQFPVKQEQITFGDLASYGMLPSLNSDASQVALTFGRGEQPKRLGKPSKALWRYEDDAASEREIPLEDIGTSGPRWIPDEMAFVTTKNYKGVVKLARYDVLTGETKKLTFDSGNKSDAFFFKAPEYNNELTLLALIDKSRFGVFRNIEGVWKKIREIRVGIDAPNVTLVSPEPFTFKGKSYFFVVCYLGQAFVSNSEIWVLSIDGTVNQPVSSDSPNTRHDPEVITTENDAFISYYTGFTAPSELHICRLILKD